MICSKDNIEECRWSPSKGVEAKYLAGGSEIFVLDEWVMKIDFLANGSIHWPVD